MKYKSIILVSLLLFLAMNSYSQNKLKANTQKPLVTFIELGSVRCIPCQKMQGVIKSVNKKYGEQVKTIFYDVWTKEGKPYAETYKIHLIPTQVFLDSEGKEYFRHEGFFPEEDLVKILKQKGVN